MLFDSHRLATGAALAAALALLGCRDQDAAGPQPQPNLSRASMEGGSSVDLGRQVFFDTRLSLHGNQACAACHDPDYGFTGPLGGVNERGSVYPGSVRSRFGNRRPPAAAYAAQAPVLHFDVGENAWIGGNFWNGRATGEVLGNPAADQAMGPFLNPVEQALPDAACVVWLVREGWYGGVYEDVWGDEPWSIDFPLDMRALCRTEGVEVPLTPPDRLKVTRAYQNIARSVAAFEGSPEVSTFSSKFDAYLAGETSLTDDEAAGLALFDGKAGCSGCHSSAGPAPLFTDYTYDNLGVPRNPLNPVYDTDPGFVDLGLGGFLGDPSLYGAQKVPTLRNLTAGPGGAPQSYMHDGVFKSLRQVVHFYNTRDVLRRCLEGEVAATPAGLRTVGFRPACWPEPEVAANVNTDELGNIGLTSAEEEQLVSFLLTLNDGWRH